MCDLRNIMLKFYRYIFRQNAKDIVTAGFNSDFAEFLFRNIARRLNAYAIFQNLF